MPTDTAPSSDVSVYDVLLIGAGHNVLVAAARLAKAGRRVLVLERNDRVGGCIQSGEATVPGAVHDLWSTNQNLFVGSPAYAELKGDLDRHGVRFAVSERPFASVFPTGAALRVYRDAARTRDGLRRHDPRDADGWQRLSAIYDDMEASLLPLMAMPLPSLAAAGALSKALATLGPTRLLTAVQAVLSTPRELGLRYVHTPEMRALLAPWAMHLDFGPDVSGGAMFPLVEAFGNQKNGMSVVEGGAQRLVDALAAIVAEHGGEVRTGVEVTRILTDGDAAIGVETASGERIGAEEVVAGVTPRLLFGRLLRDHALDADVRARADGFRYGPATMMLHLALDGPIPWAADTAAAADPNRHPDDAPLASFAYVHVATSVDALAQTYADSLAGRLPAEPLLVVGQTTAVDPTRVASAPEGTTIAWIQVRTLPSEITGDALGAIEARTWEAATAPYAERVLDLLERVAPGVRARIVGQRVYGPHDLEAHNPNLVGGDSIAGSHHLDQNFLFRPFVGASTYSMPVRHLTLVGAGTWPGAGNNGTSGFLAADKLLSSGPRLFTALAAGGAAGIAAVLKLRRGRG